MTEGSIKLGRLEPVEIGDVWKHEERNFTPWLAEPENMKILGETLGLNIDDKSIETERPVGRFRVDIFSKDEDTGSSILIENQLKPSDHRHLGQLLTYAVGTEARTIVWLAAPIRNEHREVLDLMNKIADENTRFFGLEIELWKIGDSDPAPKFNIVSQPDDWSQSAARKRGSGLSDTKRLQYEYWSAFLDKVAEAKGPINANRNPRPAPEMRFSIGRTGFSLNAVTHSRNKWIRAELYLHGPDAKERFDKLEKEKNCIASNFDDHLEWEEPLRGKRDCRIACYRKNTDLWNEDDWSEQHKWLEETLNELHKVFSQRVKNL